MGALSNEMACVPVPLPDPPVITGVRGMDKGLRISIAPPAAHQGDEAAIVIQYTVTCTAISGPYPEASRTFKAQASRSAPPPETFTMTNLANGVEYSVTVEAENSIGTGPASEPVNGFPRGSCWLCSAAPKSSSAAPTSPKLGRHTSTPVDLGDVYGSK